MQDELQTFLEAPTANHFRRLRDTLLDQSPADGLAAELLELASLAAAQDFAAVLDRTEHMHPGWSLSPRIHFYAALAAERLDREAAELERFIFQACLEGILATGDGTAESPYLVTYVSDEYDVLAVLGLLPRSQSLIDRAGTLCDVVKCTDGAEIWFELTGLAPDKRQRRAEFALLQGMRW